MDDLSNLFHCQAKLFQAIVKLLEDRMIVFTLSNSKLQLTIYSHLQYFKVTAILLSYIFLVDTIKSSDRECKLINCKDAV